MTSYSSAAVYGINKFVWKILQEELNWTTVTSAAGTIIPIIPAQEMPELTQNNKPYIVYSYSTKPDGTNWFMTEEQCSYLIYSEKNSEIRDAVNLLTTVFKRFDESAQQINDYLRANGTATHKAYDYKYASIASATSPEDEAESEGGRKAGLVVLRYCYSHDSDNLPLAFAE